MRCDRCWLFARRSSVESLAKSLSQADKMNELAPRSRLIFMQCGVETQTCELPLLETRCSFTCERITMCIFHAADLAAVTLFFFGVRRDERVCLRSLNRPSDSTFRWCMCCFLNALIQTCGQKPIVHIAHWP